MSSSTPNPKTDQSFNWRSLLIWTILALIIRWQVLEPRWIPSGSMLPTLKLQDRILVEKVRPRITKSLGKHLNHESLVIFHPPAQLVKTGYDPNSALIKRVIGLPGEVIEVHDGNLYRNGFLVKENWREEAINYEMESITVPANQIWVLGDNRNNSLDSHFWGALPEENLIGTAVWRYWPLRRFGPIRFPDPKKLSQKTLLR